jgi:hypothetical protein
MAHPEKDRLELEMDAQQTEIEQIETQINLKDASVACEGEVRHLTTAQQVHRNNIRNIQKTLRDYKP